MIGEWQETSVNVKLAGDQFWQFGFSKWSTGRNRTCPPPRRRKKAVGLLLFTDVSGVDDDGFTIFLDDPEAKQLVYDHAKKVNRLN